MYTDSSLNVTPQSSRAPPPRTRGTRAGAAALLWNTRYVFWMHFVQNLDFHHGMSITQFDAKQVQKTCLVSHQKQRVRGGRRRRGQQRRQAEHAGGRRDPAVGGLRRGRQQRRGPGVRGCRQLRGEQPARARVAGRPELGGQRSSATTSPRPAAVQPSATQLAHREIAASALAADPNGSPSSEPAAFPSFPIAPAAWGTGSSDTFGSR